ncbi:hypothetical protein FOZ62_032234 [Perkinsus olseni]|uniref:Uncharacterized protein n=1 Tax=Perkinsus olseni TaxID=32597 RepID=A0A7J6SN55_PEROL|nr:hypothetical protein FOZ62_032234 [Perkinsus olseni]
MLQPLRIQPVGYYWGSFDRSGPAKSAVDRRSLPNKEGVLPPYARGSLVAISMDLVLDIAELADECVQGSLSPCVARAGLALSTLQWVRLIQLPIEDASYGYYMYQLPRSYTIGDVDEDLFSMVPKCCTGEKACRGALYLAVQNSPTPASVGAL